MDRRTLLGAAALAAAGPASAQQAAPQQAGQPAGQVVGKGTFVLVHGAWHGGWCWAPVADILRGAGHRVFTPTQTGLGQYRHLLSREVTLDTFTDDIAGLIESEELSDVVLVGHSFGGNAVSGVADRMPERLRRLVYLDSLVIEGGRSPFGVLPADVVAARRKLAAEQGLGLALPAPAVTAFGIPEDHPLAAWVRRRMTPHPLSTFESALTLAHPVGNGRPRTYIHCTSPSYAALEGSRQWVRAQQGWDWQEIATGHDAMVLAPAELARMLAAYA